MKQVFIFLFASLAMAFNGNAQLKTMSNSGSNVSASTTLNLDGKADGYAALTTIQLDVAKTSGTVAGSAYLMGSLNGTGFDAVGADTFTVTNVASQTHIWKLTSSPYIFYRVKYVTTSGTQVSVPTATILFRKP